MTAHPILIEATMVLIAGSRAVNWRPAGGARGCSSTSIFRTDLLGVVAKAAQKDRTVCRNANPKDYPCQASTPSRCPQRRTPRKKAARDKDGPQKTASESACSADWRVGRQSSRSASAGAVSNVLLSTMKPEAVSGATRGIATSRDEAEDALTTPRTPPDEADI